MKNLIILLCAVQFSLPAFTCLAQKTVDVPSGSTDDAPCKRQPYYSLHNYTPGPIDSNAVTQLLNAAAA